jgi:hypothetical protein
MTKEERIKEYESRPETKARRRGYIKSRQTGGWFVYYIPSIHYCGITKDLYARESYHRTQSNIDTEGLTVLFHSLDAAEAHYHEAMFQSVLGIGGLNVKLN